MSLDPNLVKKAKEIYDRAVAALGPELCGYSVIDLLADNLPDKPLTLLRAVALEAGISK